MNYTIETMPTDSISPKIKIYFNAAELFASKYVDRYTSLLKYLCGLEEITTIDCSDFWEIITDGSYFLTVKNRNNGVHLHMDTQEEYKRFTKDLLEAVVSLKK